MLHVHCSVIPPNLALHALINSTFLHLDCFTSYNISFCELGLARVLLDYGVRPTAFHDSQHALGKPSPPPTL